MRKHDGLTDEMERLLIAWGCDKTVNPYVLEANDFFPKGCHTEKLFKKSEALKKNIFSLNKGLFDHQKKNLLYKLIVQGKATSRNGTVEYKERRKWWPEMG